MKVEVRIDNNLRDASLYLAYVESRAWQFLNGECKLPEAWNNDDAQLYWIGGRCSSSRSGRQEVN
jgi:hypothetical protein